MCSTDSCFDDRCPNGYEEREDRYCHNGKKCCSKYSDCEDYTHKYMCRDSCIFKDGWRDIDDKFCEDDKKCCEPIAEPGHLICNPAAKEPPCGSAVGCLEGQVCKYVMVIVGPATTYQWRCAPDSDGACSVNNCPHDPNYMCTETCSSPWQESPVYSCGAPNKKCCFNSSSKCPVDDSSFQCYPGNGFKPCPDEWSLYPGSCDEGFCCYREAGGDPNPEPYKGPTYNGPIIESLEEILNPAVRILYYGGLFVGIFFIILSGYKLMTSEGDPQRTREAQEQLTSAIIGIIFILLSTTIIRIIMKEVIGI